MIIILAAITTGIIDFFAEVAVLKDTLTKTSVPLPPKKGFNELYTQIQDS